MSPRVNGFHLSNEIAYIAISREKNKEKKKGPAIRTLIILHPLLSFTRERNSVGIWGGGGRQNNKINSLRVTFALLNRPQSI